MAKDGPWWLEWCDWLDRLSPGRQVPSPAGLPQSPPEQVSIIQNANDLAHGTGITQRRGAILVSCALGVLLTKPAVAPMHLPDSA